MADMPNDFWSGWIVVLTVVSLAVLVWLVLSIYFSAGAKAVEKEDEENEPVWDGDLREGHSAPPLWWFWLILGTMVFTVLYLMLYPGLGDYKGFLNWSQDSRVAGSYAAFHERFEVEREQIAASASSELQANPEYMAAAENLFNRHCAACHGRDAQGQALLFPNLMDSEWQWGGSEDAIEKSIRQGRKADMVSWRGVLDNRSVEQVTDYVLALGTERAAAHPGETTYSQHCAACHGADGTGQQALGAPDLSDEVWLYGGSVDKIKTSIVQGRKGEMPPFGERLDDIQIKLLVAWLKRDVTAEEAGWASRTTSANRSAE